MDRNIVYPGAIPLDTDLLNPQRDAMIGLGWFLQAVMGTASGVAGFPCAPTTPASLTVNVGPGAMWVLSEVDQNAFGSLAADTDPLMKMGILGSAAGTNFTLTPPSSSGQSINYLIEAAFTEADTTPVVLPYMNAANPSQPYSGPSNSGTAQNTIRAQTVALQLKAGAAATTGTQTTPAVDSGYVGLYVITVAYGQSSVTASNIAAYGGTIFVGPSLLQAAQSGSMVYSKDTSATANTITLALTPAITAYTDGLVVRFKTANANTGATTINVNGLGAVALNSPAGALQGGEIVAGGQYSAIYNAASSDFVLVESGAGALAVNAATESNHAVNLGQLQGRTFVSGWQTLGANQTIIVVHNLGGTPKAFGAYLQCVTAELGYNQYDIAGFDLDDGASHHGSNPVRANSTGLILATGDSTFRVIQQVDNINADWTAITPANWRLVMWATI